jgi:hypothetical protein
MSAETPLRIHSGVGALALTVFPEHRLSSEKSPGEPHNAGRQEDHMAVELMHPDGLRQQTDYSPAAVGTGSRLVLLAGQAGVHAALRNIIREATVILD